MIKGCNKRVIWIRNTENALFEQAYFILSDTACTGEVSEGDIIKEAKQLINTSPVCNYWDTDPGTQKYIKRRSEARSVRSKIIFFSIGFILGALPALIFLLR